MRNPNSFGVHFLLRPNKGKVESYQVYLRITVNKKRCELATKCLVRKEDWNIGKGAAKNKNDKLRELNTYLEQIRGKVIYHFQQLTLKGVTTANALKNAYLGLIENANELGLLDLVELHNKEAESLVKKGTIKNYYTTAKYVRNFLSVSGDIPPRNVNYRLITELELYIRKNPLKQSDPCGNNGTMKHMERLKKIVGWAIKNEWLDKNPFTGYRTHYKPKIMEVLTNEELTKIEHCNLNSPYLTAVRDLFIFSCYTGLPYSDIITLKRSQIVVREGGQQWIESARIKTGAPIRVPLLKPALTVLHIYTSTNVMTTENVFPWISNQAINKTLKTIAKTCNIRKNLTFHTARHTFATTVALENNVPIETISKLLGHTKITTTMIYAKVALSKIGKDMKALQNRLDENKRLIYEFDGKD